MFFVRRIEPSSVPWISPYGHSARGGEGGGHEGAPAWRRSAGDLGAVEQQGPGSGAEEGLERAADSARAYRGAAAAAAAAEAADRRTLNRHGKFGRNPLADSHVAFRLYYKLGSYVRQSQFSFLFLFLFQRYSVDNTDEVSFLLSCQSWCEGSDNILQCVNGRKENMEKKSTCNTYSEEIETFLGKFKFNWMEKISKLQLFCQK